MICPNCERELCICHMTNSDTPRTDARAVGFRRQTVGAVESAIEWAKELERELAEAQQAHNLWQEEALHNRTYRDQVVLACDQRNEAEQRAEQSEHSAAELIERCANVCEARANRRWEEYGYTEPDTNASYYPKEYEWCETADEEASDCAAAIRALSPL